MLRLIKAAVLNPPLIFMYRGQKIDDPKYTEMDFVGDEVKGC